MQEGFRRPPVTNDQNQDTETWKDRKAMPSSANNTTKLPDNSKIAPNWKFFRLHISLELAEEKIIADFSKTSNFSAKYR